MLQEDVDYSNVQDFKDDSENSVSNALRTVRPNIKLSRIRQ